MCASDWAQVSTYKHFLKSKIHVAFADGRVFTALITARGSRMGVRIMCTPEQTRENQHEVGGQIHA